MNARFQRRQAQRLSFRAAASVISLDAGERGPFVADAEGEGLKWNVLLHTGTFHRSDFGKITITREHLATMVANWKAMGGQGLPFDFHHWGGSDRPDVRLEDKRASGWIEKLEVRPGEPDLLYGLVDWTDEARGLIRTKKYRYLSPSFAMDAQSRTTGKSQGPTFYGAGLLNDPFLTTLPRVAASASGVPPAQPNPAPVAKEQHAMKKLNLLFAALAISVPAEPTDADFDNAIKSIEDLKAKNTETVKMSAAAETTALKLSALESKTAALEKANADLLAANKNAAIDAELVKLQDRLTTTDEKGAFRKYAMAIGLDEAVKVHSAFPVKVSAKELGHNTGGGERESLASAHVKLSAVQADLVKTGLSPADAWVRAIELNGALADQTREVKALDQA